MRMWWLIHFQDDFNLSQLVDFDPNTFDDVWYLDMREMIKNKERLPDLKVDDGMIFRRNTKD